MARFDKLTIDPVRNPAVLDTSTWDPEDAWKQLLRVEDAYWQELEECIKKEKPVPLRKGLKPFNGSCSRSADSSFVLAELADGQLVFLSIGKLVKGMENPAHSKTNSTGHTVAMYKTDARTVDRYFRIISPDRGPRALGSVPRLGIGSRMTTAIWPAVWPAMQECRFSANAIQNSLRELNLLEDLLAGRPAKTNYQFSFGNMLEGHTGSTFEGLWLTGVLEALKNETRPIFGADADHIMVKRDPGGLERAKHIIDAARYYTFYTLDVSDILNYKALFQQSASAAEMHLINTIASEAQRQDILTFHLQERRTTPMKKWWDFSWASIGVR
jgi:hypothetical protein